ncbi:YihY/virulence factor BrkB family protein [Allobranchiibius sp. GilTou38]|nr:YihY/virulence factor BrkB family protein [Allobranchiibius sp. GilTou38]MBO1767317.1 YihY/virulence factor BrkB family protein [Allobranchiibius sp. GilTou38]
MILRHHRGVTDAGSTPTKEPSRRTLWLDDFQRRHRIAGFPIAVVYKFFDDSGSYLAALMTYYGFVSLFPLLLLLSTVLSFVLRHYPQLQQEIVNSAAGQFPIVGKQLQDPKRLSGSLGGVLAGLAIAIYGGLGIGQAVQYAMNTAWAVPRNERPDPFSGRLRSLLLIGVTALVLLAATAASAIVGLINGQWWVLIMHWALPLALDTLLFIPIYRHGASRKLKIRQVLPGALIAAVALTLLQTYGVRYVSRVVDHAKNSETNVIFATVLGLLAFIYLASVITVFCTEINVVIDKKLYPRALLTPFTDNVQLTGGDRRTYVALAKAQRHKGFEKIDVTFDQPPPSEPGAAADSGADAHTDRQDSPTEPMPERPVEERRWLR